MPCFNSILRRGVLFLLLPATFLVSVPGALLSAEAVANEEAIADVEAGRVETAQAAWWGFNPEDATEALQAALDSAAERVVVENTGSPWIVTTIQLPSDKVIVFEEGAVVEAKRGEFLGKGDCLFVARGRKNLTLRGEGEGATLRMHKSDYHEPPYEPAEWRHALSIRGCENVTVEGLTLAQSGGDGIYLGVGSNNATNRNVTIRNVVCDANNRQGISVITAEDLLIENTALVNTRGTAPQAGIDFEPNRPQERLVNCVLRNCRSEDNAGHAYHIYLGNMHEDSPPISIRFEDCTSKGCERYSAYVGVANREGKRTVRGSIQYVGCRFDGDDGAGVYIRGNEAEGCRVRLEECEIIRRDEKLSRLAPITIEAPRRLDVDTGNIAVVECTIRDALVRPPIALIASPLTGLRNVSGSLTVESPEGRTAYELDVEQLAEWFPLQGLVAEIPRHEFDWHRSEPLGGDSAGDRKASTFRLRRQATLLAWGEMGKPLELAVKMEPVGRHTPDADALSVKSPDGRTIRLKPEVQEGRAVYQFTPEATGPHRLHWEGDNKETLRPVRCTAPLAFLGESLGVHLIRPIGTLYFPVPIGVERFALQVAGAGTAETVKATVRNAAGKVVGEQDDIAAPHVFVLKRRDLAATEIWSVTLERAGSGVLEDVSVQAVGVPPVFAATPGDVFVAAAD